MDKFTLELKDGDNWKITGTNPKMYHCIGYCLTCVDGKYFIQSPKNVQEGKGYKVKTAHVFETVYNLFEEPDLQYLKNNWRKMMGGKIKEALEINDEAIRQLYLDCVWGFNKAPKLKKANT